MKLKILMKFSIEKTKVDVIDYNLSSNQFMKLPYQLMHLENLKKLVLNNNKIGSLDNLREKCDLEELDISSNKIKELPISLYRLQFLTELDISQNTQLNDQIASFDSKISKCNFKNTNIDCFDVGTCIIIDDDSNQNQYNACPKEKNDREADINVSLTLKPSNVYSANTTSSNNNNNNNRNQNNGNNYNRNTQAPFDLILFEYHTSSSMNQVPSPNILNNNVQNSNINNNQNQNMNNNIVYNNTLTTTSTSQIVSSQPSDRSYIFVANTSNSNIVSPMQSPIPVSQASTINNAPLQSPIPVSQASTINNALLQSPNYVPFNNPTGLPNGQMNDGQVFTVLPLQIISNPSNVNYYNYDLMNKMNMTAGISSTSSNNIIDGEKKTLAKDKGLDTEEMIDIKYQKIILQEEDIIRKCYDNYNLPLYSQ
ncbi:hypothetical protein H8356DRAFT_1398370 [Neocallimastix lanati (nom. inval.)]|uniref:L domain-like protein n=1 Tax=Neocallimastix californiae TaxID=1754190 RepID=A0A1Y2EGM3_9FUNG|nr:hypothetical protein H8356DRAFT_1398370 [Neocallimastix sp. JGI-2020a]ORY70567.1 hypothetical protein LY90DRAFT_504138 [Neocallimastix californiae]|eukprot:ORY70567.1 hypothetical protein LY90DRAFT_504138 [Neocallimastix californiae]